MNNNCDFNIVYDCGSHTKGSCLSNQISLYKNRVKTIDLLILSHLHEDHVNGLQQLLSNGMKCKTVILPYLLPVERLLIAVLHAKDGNIDGNYLSFLSDPVSFFTENMVERVVLIDGYDTDGEKNIEPVPPVDPDENQNERFFSTQSFELSFPENNIALNEKFNDYETASSLNNLLFLNCGPTISIQYLWEFIFFNKKVDTRILIQFENQIKKVFPLIKEGKMHVQEIKEIISDQDKLAKLSAVYKRIFVDLNLTSLCVYHASLVSANSPRALAFSISNCRLYLGDEYYSLCDGECCWRSGYRNRTRRGTLLTGDYRLGTINNQEELFKFLENRWGNIALFQMPHHGSKYNWKVGKRKPSHFVDFSHYVFNYGLGNQHKHPHEDVILSLMQHNKRILRNDQITRCSYCIYF